MPDFEPTSYELSALQELYRDDFTQGPSRLPFEEFCNEQHVPRSAIYKSFRHLTESGLAEPASIGMYLRLTSEGVNYLELNGLVDQALSAAQDECRKLILKKAYEAYEEHGRQSRLHLDQVRYDAKVSLGACASNLYYLRDRMFVSIEHSHFQITEFGMEAWRYLQFSENIEATWRELLEGTSMSPQARGHALEKLLEAIALSENLQVETNVRSTGEENDLVIGRGHDHFLLSCKWEKKRAPAHYLDSLRMRLQKRPGTLGVLVSVGGFTKDLVREAESNTSLGMVMLFGKGDLENLFTGKTRLKELLEERHSFLVKYRKVFFEPGP